MHPIITIFCSFTRLWAIDQWLKDLAVVEHDPALTNLAFIIDADEPSIKSQLEAFSRERNYRSCQIIMNSDHAPNEVRIGVRRQRIAEVKNQSKNLIANADGEYVIGLEDDTRFPVQDLIAKLVRPLQGINNIGFVEGVQCGRWGVRMIGVWAFDDLIMPSHAKTLLPPQVNISKNFIQQRRTIINDYEEIDAGGFYGYATRKSLYLNHDYYGASTQPWGPDVNFGLWVRSQGYKCLVHWPTEFGHDDHGSVAWPSSEKLAQVIYTKNNISGKWDRNDVEKSY